MDYGVLLPEYTLSHPHKAAIIAHIRSSNMPDSLTFDLEIGRRLRLLFHVLIRKKKGHRRL